MTVIQLVGKLAWEVVTFQVSPNAPVVREFGDWADDGTSNYKEIDFVDLKERHVVPDPYPGEGLSHRLYNVVGDGPVRTIVALD